MNLNDLFTEEKVRLDPKCWTGKKIGNPKTKVKGGVRVNNCVPAESVAEAQTDYQKRRQRERDVDAGKPVKPEPKNPQNDYFARRKKERDMAEGVMYGAEELNVGDPVIITGNVEFEGTTGEIAEFGRDKRFVVVDLYNHGQHSFHSSDVSFNEYAGSDDEEVRMHDAGEFGDDPRDDMHEGEQQKGADYRDPKEVDYDDEYDAMVSRVKKLAGLGPMKTVYDPARRQYRNMPTAVQPKK